MNTARITILLDNYAAHFPEDGGVPEHLGALWQAARTCAASFDPAAEDLSGMLQRAFMDATSVINYTSSVQPLYGMYALAAPEQMTEQYRGALTILLGDDKGDLTRRQQRMKQYCEQCAGLLRQIEKAKRSWDQNLRAAITLMAIICPAENYLYKATEARYLADMLGCQTDMASGAHFTLSGFYGMCDVLAQAVAVHPVLAARIPAEDALPAEALLHLMVGDILLNAGPKKLALFGDMEALIQTRSRAGQAAQEREARLQVLRLEKENRMQHMMEIDDRLKGMSIPELVGQRCQTKAFGEAVVQGVQGSIISLETEKGVRRMSMPGCFLQGFVTPEDPAIAAFYNAVAVLLEERRNVESEILELECSIRKQDAKG